jgi:ankyrin repeat protein
LFKAIDDAFRAGDFEGLGLALGGSQRWVDEKMPFELGLGHPLEYAIHWSPVAFIEKLIDAGSNPNYEDDGGFPSIIAALSTDRKDKLEIIQVLINHGADTNRRGVNDWTPLHYAASIRDLNAISLLLASRADPCLRTRIDDCATALEEAEEVGFGPGAALLQKAMIHHIGGSRGN